MMRWEAYNLTNTPQFDEPQRNLSAPAFGKITNALNDGRVFQVGLRLVNVPDPWPGMDAVEPAELEEEIEAGYRDAQNADVEDGIAFDEQLFANTK